MLLTTHGPRLAAALGPVLLAAVALVMLLSAAGPAAVAVDDLTQLLAAGSAALACASTARRVTGRRRQAWVALAAGCACWAAGQAVWTWYELVLGDDTPFPSPGDAGFLAFPVAATVAVVLHPAPSTTPGDRQRRLLDGLLVSASLGLVSWVTALGAAFDRQPDALSAVVAVAYPAGDVVVLTMVVILLSRATTERRALRWSAPASATIALADSAFLYLDRDRRLRQRPAPARPRLVRAASCSSPSARCSLRTRARRAAHRAGRAPG